MAQISLILMRTLSLWFGLHPLKSEFAIKNLKSENGLGLCRPNESDRETDRKWGLEVGAGANLIGNVRESNESKYFEIHCDFTLLHFDVRKQREKERNVKIWAWLQTIFNQPPPIGLLLLQACDLPPPSIAPLNSHQLFLANFKHR